MRPILASITAAFFCAPFAWGQVVQPQGPEPARLPAPPGAEVGDSEDYQTLVSGPVHEAFASPYSGEPQPGLVVEQTPPEPVDEVPPEYAPTGTNVVWVPGYWGWEPEQQDFIWISGVWRSPPPNQTWVPGYWAQADEGFQWVSGFWKDVSEDSLVYLPYPPDTLEHGPTAPAPEGDFFWVPGCWNWTGGDYQWRPGYWARAQENWVWMPERHVWTPYGCVHVPGYWDYRLDERGILFAPVRFSSVVYGRPGFRYSPSYAIEVTASIVQWFVSPRAHHYYFGNYYRGNYARVGLLPWYTYASRRDSYDPLLNYYNWYYQRQNVDFSDRLRNWHHFYETHEDARPGFTLHEHRERLHRAGDHREGRLPLARRIDELARAEESPIRLTSVDEARRRDFVERSQVIRNRAQERRQFEPAQSRGRPAPGEQGAEAVRRLRLPGIAARPDGPREERGRDARPEADSKRVDDARRQIQRQPGAEPKAPAIPEQLRPDRGRDAGRPATPEQRKDHRGFDPKQIFRPQEEAGKAQKDQKAAPKVDIRRYQTPQRPPQESAPQRKAPEAKPGRQVLPPIPGLDQRRTSPQPDQRRVQPQPDQRRTLPQPGQRPTPQPGLRPMPPQQDQRRTQPRPQQPTPQPRPQIPAPQPRPQQPSPQPRAQQPAPRPQQPAPRATPKFAPKMERKPAGPPPEQRRSRPENPGRGQSKKKG